MEKRMEKQEQVSQWPWVLHWLGAVLIIIGLLLLEGCAPGGQAVAGKTTEKEKPANVSSVDGSDLKRVDLTQKAAERIGIQTVTIEKQQVDTKTIVDTEAQKDTKADGQAVPVTGVDGPSVPYAAVIYDVKGDTWVYTNPEPLGFVRYRVKVLRIEGDKAILAEAVPAGTKVVTSGAVELYGAETGVGK